MSKCPRQHVRGPSVSLPRHSLSGQPLTTSRSRHTQPCTLKPALPMASLPLRSAATALRSSSKLALESQPFSHVRPTITRPRLQGFQTQVSVPKHPSFAFAFDIDGVLLRSSTPLPGASAALTYLQRNSIPFILLTNGGGKSETDRVAELADKLGVELDIGMFVQSHTPFSELNEYKDKTVLVVGGDFDGCQRVAVEEYGFKDVVTPGDIVAAYPDIWPFSKVFMEYYKSFAKPLPRPINPANLPESLKIDAIFVYNDPRDWALDSTVILDLLLSQQGYLGTLSKKNDTPALPNRGYLQDAQPHLFYSNPDLWWASSYPLSRLGQGGFQAAFRGLWSTVTNGADLPHTLIGKPHQPTFEFAERRLRGHRKKLFGNVVGLNEPLKRVYMVGDNPASDIAGANGYVSPHGTQWRSILVKTGVHKDGEVPAHAPTVIVEGVQEAVKWALKDARKG